MEIGVALTQHHLPGDWNEVHPYIRHEERGWFLGAFLNSEDRISVGVGKKFFISNSLFGEFGVATGYDVSALVPMLRVGLETGRVRAFVMPAATKEGDLGVVFGIEGSLIEW